MPEDAQLNWGHVEREKYVRSQGHGEQIDLLRASCDYFSSALQRALKDPIPRADLTPYRGILIGMTAHSLMILQAVTDLLFIGHSASAAALHRTLFELFLQTRWLRQDPGPRSDLFLYFNHLWRWYAFKHTEGDIQDHNKEERRDEIARAIVRVARHYKVITSDEEEQECLKDPDLYASRLKKVFPGAGPGKWHGKSVATLVDEVGKNFPKAGNFETGLDYLTYQYRVVYAVTSNLVHGAPYHIMERLFGDMDKGEMTLDLRPDTKHTHAVVETSFRYVYWIFEVLNEELPFDLNDGLQPIVDKLKALDESIEQQ